MKLLICSVVTLSMMLLAMTALAAQQALAAPAVLPFPVTSTVDDIDDNPGNGLCHTDPLGPAAGLCTLRAAVMEANRTSGPGANIMLPAGIYTLTISADVADNDNKGDLNLTTPASGNPLIMIIGAGGRCQKDKCGECQSVSEGASERASQGACDWPGF